MYQGEVRNLNLLLVNNPVSHTHPKINISVKLAIEESQNSIVGCITWMVLSPIAFSCCSVGFLWHSFEPEVLFPRGVWGLRLLAEHWEWAEVWKQNRAKGGIGTKLFKTKREVSASGRVWKALTVSVLDPGTACWHCSVRMKLLLLISHLQSHFPPGIT